MALAMLMLGITIGCAVGWWITARNYRSLIASIDGQNSRLLRERRELLEKAARQRKLLAKADGAIHNAKLHRNHQAQLIVDLRKQSEDPPNRESASA